MTELSPQAQAVMDAFFKAPMQRTHIADDYHALAAALRAAADQVAPNEEHPEQSQFWDAEADREWQNSQHFRRQLLDIAAELGGVNNRELLLNKKYKTYEAFIQEVGYVDEQND